MLIRQAAFATFSDPLPECCLHLVLLTLREWKDLLRWLDTSGLALYFLDRIVELRMLNMLPVSVLSRLRQNLSDNSKRIQDLRYEYEFLDCSFQRAGLIYATVKGFSLWPDSVAKIELRSQLDLDFVISANSVMHAREILESRGYHLHAASGTSWEFKANQVVGMSLKEMYKPSPFRCVELHIEPAEAGTRLERRNKRSIGGIDAFVLTEVDQFIDQATHIYKHLTRDFFRLAHLLEFCRHIEARRNHQAFWKQVIAEASIRENARMSLGVVILLIFRLQGSSAPEVLAEWAVGAVPVGTRLWIERYGICLAFADFPGTKLSQILREEIASAQSHKPVKKKTLIPLRLPPRMVGAVANEGLHHRLYRHWCEMRFILFRSRFHAVEGIRYLIESRRWKRYKQRAITRHKALTPARDSEGTYFYQTKK